MLNKAKTAELFKRLSAVIDPKPELEYGNVFQLLVAVVLSAQATDKSVNIATREFFPTKKTPQDFLEWGLENLMAATHSIGLYRNKSKSIIGLCQKLVDEFSGEVPGTRDELMAKNGAYASLEAAQEA